MPIEVTLAKLSPTMESGQLVKWLVKVGDKVNEGDTLAEIQTDKAVMPMESFEEGTVAYLDVSEGEDIALGSACFCSRPRAKTRPSWVRRPSRARNRPRPRLRRPSLNPRMSPPVTRRRPMAKESRPRPMLTQEAG